MVSDHPGAHISLLLRQQTNTRALHTIEGLILLHRANRELFISQQQLRQITALRKLNTRVSGKCNRASLLPPASADLEAQREWRTEREFEKCNLLFPEADLIAALFASRGHPYRMPATQRQI
jgi:hypothetical protein